MLSTNNSLHISRVLKGNYAYVCESSGVIEQVQRPGQCNLVMTNERISTIQYSIGLQKNSHYEEMFTNK